MSGTGNLFKVEEIKIKGYVKIWEQNLKQSPVNLCLGCCFVFNHDSAPKHSHPWWRPGSRRPKSTLIVISVIKGLHKSLISVPLFLCLATLGKIFIEGLMVKSSCIYKTALIISVLLPGYIWCGQQQFSDTDRYTITASEYWEVNQMFSFIFYVYSINICLCQLTDLPEGVSHHKLMLCK